MKNRKAFILVVFLSLCSCQGGGVSSSSTSTARSIEASDSAISSMDSSSVSSLSDISDSKTTENVESSSGSEKEACFEALSLTVLSGQRFNYYLYSPENRGENTPLILYLHGGSGKPQSEEGNLSLLTSGDGLPKFVMDKQVAPDSYIVFPQLPYGKKGWSDVKDDLFAFLKAVSDELGCNKERISITGHSMGGKGTWDIALSYPATFYKVAPLSGAVTLSEINVNKLKSKPVWAFVGSDDTIVDPQSSIDFIAALGKINDEAKITVIDGYTHFDVPNVYLSTEYNLLSWLVE